MPTANEKYIYSLQKERAELQGKINAGQELVTDLTTYLLSEKFYSDTTVQTQDVLNRLREIRSALAPD